MRPRGDISKYFPFMQWLGAVNARALRADLLAGLTGAVIVLPQGVAFAVIAGLPPEYGLYSAMVPAVVAALMGSSAHLISGPTTAISIVIYSSLSPALVPASPDYIQAALTLTFLAGMVQLVLGLIRLGALVNFVSHSVVLGFTAGAAILIATSQLVSFLGVPSTKAHSFVHIWQHIAGSLADINPYVVAISASTLAIAIAFRVLAPRWPGLLIALVCGSLISIALEGQQHGVRLVGSLPAQLPPLSSPSLSMASIRQLAPSALAVAMLGLTEAVSIARAVAARSQQRIDNNQEFIGQGLSNVVGSFFSSYASSGSFTRTGVNYSAGAKTPLAAVFAAASLALIVLLIAPLTAYLPIPAMAGVLLVVAAGLVDPHHIGGILRSSRQEAGVLGATFLATLFVELEFAIYIGVILSLVLYLNRTSHPAVVTLAPDTHSPRRTLTNIKRAQLLECPQLMILRVDGSLFFGAVDHFAQEIERVTEQNPEQAHILVIAEGINFIDSAGCQALAQEAHRLRVDGRQMYMCSIKGEVLAVMQRGPCGKQIGTDNLFDNKTGAIARIVPRLDPQRCAVCKARVFHECAQMPGA